MKTKYVLIYQFYRLLQNAIGQHAKNLRSKRSIIYLTLLFTACAAPTMPVGYYTGSINPTSLSNSCKPGQAILNIQNGQILFVPNDATWTLQGTADPDGKLQADRTGRGANKLPYSTRFTGTWAKEAVSGTYTTSKCNYAVNLARHR